jgi:ribonuclease HII
MDQGVGLHMGLLIGMDEAGYGPNLGPLVITVTAWEVPRHPAKCDLWESFTEVVSPEAAGDGRLHLADSKKVYSPATGIGRLEHTVLSALRMHGFSPPSYRHLRDHLIDGGDGSCRKEPCIKQSDLPLPHMSQDPAGNDAVTTRWRECCERNRVGLKAVRSEIVWPERWNALNRENANKAETLTRLTLRLLRRVWSPESDEPALVVADKHGGRNRYDGYLQEIADGAMIFRLREGQDVSRYRIGSTELRFQAGGEAHLPVALASMVSKYVRELSMELFNRFWAAHVPDVKPTKGYPVDARRFRVDIAEAQRRLDIPDSVLWRER